jgi:hypothetical protein
MLGTCVRIPSEPPVGKGAAKMKPSVMWLGKTPKHKPPGTQMKRLARNRVWGIDIYGHRRRKAKKRSSITYPRKGKATICGENLITPLARKSHAVIWSREGPKFTPKEELGKNTSLSQSLYYIRSIAYPGCVATQIERGEIHSVY